MTLWATLPRGPVRDSDRGGDWTVDTLCSDAVGGRPGGPASDGTEACDGPKAAHLHSRHLVQRAVTLRWAADRAARRVTERKTGRRRQACPFDTLRRDTVGCRPRCPVRDRGGDRHKAAHSTVDTLCSDTVGCRPRCPVSD